MNEDHFDRDIREGDGLENKLSQCLSRKMCCYALSLLSTAVPEVYSDDPHLLTLLSTNGNNFALVLHYFGSYRFGSC